MFDLTLPQGAAVTFLVLTLPFCIWVALSDIRSMKIRNNAVIGLIAVFLASGAFAFPVSTFAWHLLFGIIALAIGFALNAGGILGAGDAKFIAAATPFIMPQDAVAVIYLLAVILLVTFIAHRVLRAIPGVRNALPHWESWTNPKFPMGLALGPTLSLYFTFAAIG
ncbi:A24 family peptidase [Palleronia abyssalis]|uniref:Prepilin type IV endopeptidase peptidase domain-containing protein n=1 Tax=Palleronia abyssalis TaxID=1501240 RepID=A0A2R8BX75_9RHOB|nr:prepilin peptidase [Palleronia abyssalis]SPJ24755.1 hypothetical protein PAA8504_02593 [Palleronia abyssalis]